MIPLGDTEVGIGVAGLTLGVAALAVLGLFVCAGISFHRSRAWKISFWCSPTVC